MATTPLPWVGVYVWKLRGEDPIMEVRVKLGKEQYRPLGYLGPKADQFTLLVGAKEKSGRFDPPDAPTTAKSRVRRIEKGEANTCEHFSG